jgi:hypothetical protein
MLIGALALACDCVWQDHEAKARCESDLPRTAAEYVAVYNDWDANQLAALYGKKSPDIVKQQAKLTWLHDRLGDVRRAGG